MSTRVVEAFEVRLAVEAAGLFVVDHGHRLWFDREHALQFAFIESLLHHRKHQVHGVHVAGRWLWHVRAVPATSLIDDGAGAPSAAGPSPVVVVAAASAPAPSSSSRCTYREPVS